MDTVTEKKSDLLDQLTLVKTQYDAATLSLSQKQSQVGRFRVESDPMKS